MEVHPQPYSNYSSFHSFHPTSASSASASMSLSASASPYTPASLSPHHTPSQTQPYPSLTQNTSSSLFIDPSTIHVTKPIATSSRYVSSVDSNDAFAAKAAAANKYAQRAALASTLSGLWEGRSSRHASHISAGIHPHTDWTKCDLRFNIDDGRINGGGISVWNEKEIPFKIQGCFDRRLEHVELVKLHHGEYTTSTHYSLNIIILANQNSSNIANSKQIVMEGTYAHGTIRLVKIQNAKLTTSTSAHSLPTLSMMSNTLSSLQSSISSPLSSLANPLTASNTTSSLSSLLHASPALDPAAMFLHHLFGAREGEKFFQLLQDNQVDFDALKLMKESHLKELGFAMGPRLKILNSLPSYVSSQAPLSSSTPQPIGNSNSMTSLPPTSVLLGSGFGMLGGTNLLSPNGTHKLQTNEQQQPQQQQQPQKIPADFICSITHEIMEDPVVLADGHTYERSAINTWLLSKNTSPLTGKILRTKELRSNMSLKSIIQEWKDRENWSSS